MAIEYEAQLKLPGERVLFAATVVLNIALFALAFWLLTYHETWLAQHKRLHDLVDGARTILMGLLLAPPTLVLLRNLRHAGYLCNGIRLSHTQVPELHDTLVRFCARLGVTAVPGLYVSQEEGITASAAYSAWDSHYIVIRPIYLETPLEEVRDIYEFEIGRELGKIRLGHTKWWDELLIVYVMKIPLLRNPLLHVRTYAHDRYAAYLAPRSIRGLIVAASGRHLFKSVNIPEFIHQAEAAQGVWPWLANLTRISPNVTFRALALYDADLYSRLGVSALEFPPL